MDNFYTQGVLFLFKTAPLDKQSHCRNKNHSAYIFLEPSTINILSHNDKLLKVIHNTCSLHLATHFQNQTSHMGMFYMVY